MGWRCSHREVFPRHRAMANRWKSCVYTHTHSQIASQFTIIRTSHLKPYPWYGSAEKRNLQCWKVVCDNFHFNAGGDQTAKDDMGHEKCSINECQVMYPVYAYIHTYICRLLYHCHLAWFDAVSAVDPLVCLCTQPPP